MTRDELISELKELTGRYDYTDDRATQWLNRGIKLLDKLCDLNQKMTRFYAKISPGNNTILLPRACRVIFDVALYSADERLSISRVSLEEMREIFNTMPIVADRATPYLYTPVTVSIDKTTRVDELSFYTQWGDLLLVNPEDFNGLLLYPASDEYYAVEIIGKFYSESLSEDINQNWWTLRAEDLVLLAAQYKIQVLEYKDNKTAGELLQTIITETKLLTYDEVEDESADTGAVMEPKVEVINNG